MSVSELHDADALAFRLVELERREAEVEGRLAALLETHGPSPDELAERLIAALRRDHLEIRRELNTVRARLVPLSLAPRR